MSGKNIYVGNLPFSASEDEVRALFEEHGSVTSVRLIEDRFTGRPRGFGFVEMDQDGVDAAIEALDGTMFGGRPPSCEYCQGPPATRADPLVAHPLPAPHVRRAKPPAPFPGAFLFCAHRVRRQNAFFVT